MKKLLWFLIPLFCAQGLFAQALVNFSNRIIPDYITAVYGVDGTDPHSPKTGNSPADLPPGTTVYGGAPVSGSGFTVQLWAAPGSTPDENALALVPDGTSSFRTLAAAGFWIPKTVAVPGVTGGLGTHVTAQVRVWDNPGGLIATWQDAQTAWQAGLIAAGESPLFGIDNLGPDAASAADLRNMVSFQLWIPTAVPEPAAASIALLCCLMGWVGKRFRP